MTAKERVSLCDLSTASLEGKDSPAPYDLDRTLAEAAGEMRFDRAELLLEPTRQESGCIRLGQAGQW